MSMDVKYLGFTASDYFAALAPSDERLQAFELYSGVASIHKAAVRAGKTSTTFDNEADKRQDMLIQESFQMALNNVLRIEKDGLFTCAQMQQLHHCMRGKPLEVGSQQLHGRPESGVRSGRQRHRNGNSFLASGRTHARSPMRAGEPSVLQDLEVPYFEGSARVFA